MSLPQIPSRPIHTVMKTKDRIIRCDRVRANTLLPHPSNWRQHPEPQMNALRGVLAEIGWADCILARETGEGLQILDGHARTSLAPDSEVPVLILDLNDEEADYIKATFAVLLEGHQYRYIKLIDLKARLTCPVLP